MKNRLWTFLFPILVYICLTFATVQSISFHVLPDVRKCLREEVHKDVVVVGEYELSSVSGQTTDIAVSTAFVIF